MTDKLPVLKDLLTWNDWDKTGGENVNSHTLRVAAKKWHSLIYADYYFIGAPGKKRPILPEWLQDELNPDDFNNANSAILAFIEHFFGLEDENERD